MELITSLLDFMIGLAYGNWRKFAHPRKRDTLSLAHYVFIFFGFLVLLTLIYLA